jgi:hypothetical protein
LIRNLKGRYHIGDISADGRLLNCSIEKKVVKIEIGFN